MPVNETPGALFAPTFENAELASARGGPAPQGPLQVLSYRLKPTPAVRGGFSPLASDRRSGVGNNALIQSVLQTVLGPEAAQAFLASISDEDLGADRAGRSVRPTGQTPAPLVSIGSGPPPNLGGTTNPEYLGPGGPPQFGGVIGGHLGTFMPSQPPGAWGRPARDEGQTRY